jgi:hypothetical protein
MAIDRMKNPDPDPKKKYGAKDEDDIVNWYRKYYNSDLFRKNLYDPQMPGSGYSLGQWSTGDPIPSQKNTDIGKLMTKYVTKVKTRYPGKGSSATDDSSIDMGDPNVYGNQPKSGIYAHEMAHVGQEQILDRQPSMIKFMLNKNKKWNRKDYANDLSKSLNEPIVQYYSGPEYPSEEAKREGVLSKFNQNERTMALTGSSSHDNAVHEIRADIMALRYLAAKKGIWDAVNNKSGAFTPEMLNKLYQDKELNTPITTVLPTGVSTTLPRAEHMKQGNLKEVAPPKNPGLFLQRIRERFNDDDILYLMNKVAKKELPSNLKSMKNTDYSS